MTTEGIEAATTRRIAAEAGVAVGVVHYCFGTKENLYRQVISAIVDDAANSAATAMHPGDSVVACLSRATEGLVTSMEAQPERHLLTYELTTYALRHPAAHDLAEYQYQCYNDAAVMFFNEVAEVASIRWSVSVEMLARMFTAFNEGMTLAWLVDRDGDKVRSIFASFADLFISVALPVAAAQPTSNTSPQ
jgi:AcrR family transcriptional regulator